MARPVYLLQRTYLVTGVECTPWGGQVGDLRIG
jgi:hypothetical protein